MTAGPGSVRERRSRASNDEGGEAVREAGWIATVEDMTSTYVVL
jgi:hypothetical protein